MGKQSHYQYVWWFGRTQKDIMGKLKMVGTVKEFAPYEAKQLNKKLVEVVTPILMHYAG